jgi:hypothetical protein
LFTVVVGLIERRRRRVCPIVVAKTRCLSVRHVNVCGCLSTLSQFVFDIGRTNRSTHGACTDCDHRPGLVLAHLAALTASPQKKQAAHNGAA